MYSAFDIASSDAFVNCPVVHHFDKPSARAYRPGCAELVFCPRDICASQSPLDRVLLVKEGGAEGTSGYLALAGVDADEFYAESTPVWWVPARLYDLRDTWTAFYLKAITPITVAPGYEPFLFIAASVPDSSVSRGYHTDGWYLKGELTVGTDDWALNVRHLVNDPSKWVHYAHWNTNDTLDWALGNCGYIGWMYYNGNEFRGVRANGTMGWDEMRYNLTAADVEKIKNGQTLVPALEL